MADISKLSPDGGTTEYDIKDSTARANIGDLSELETTDKSDLVSAINEVAQGGGGGGSVTGVKGDSETTYRTGNVNITKADIGLGNVENKSSATIRGELTSSNVTTALGYTPLSKSSNGSVGQFAVSDGQGGVTWLTMTNAEEVQY